MNWTDFFAGVGAASIVVYVIGIIRDRRKDKGNS